MMYIKKRDSHPLYPTYVPMEKREYQKRVAIVFSIMVIWAIIAFK